MALGSGERDRGSTFAVDADGRQIVNIGGAGSGATVTVDTELPAAAALSSDAVANPTAPVVGGFLHVFNGAAGQWSRAYAGSDGQGRGTVVGTIPHLYNGLSVDMQRTATTFKTFANTAITAGTAISVWTPTSGKKFRLLGMTMSVSATTQVLVCDNTNATIIFRSPLFAAAATFTIGASDMGNGILSTTINNVLKLDATANASVAGTVWGCEE